MKRANIYNTNNLQYVLQYVMVSHIFWFLKPTRKRGIPQLYTTAFDKIYKNLQICYGYVNKSALKLER